MLQREPVGRGVGLPVILSLLFQLAGLAAPTTGAAEPVKPGTFRPSSLPTGQIVERVTSEANPAQQYAVFLPSRYTPDRTWPLLLVMDPRGRALFPLERLREVADRLGYIAVSSYNSRSDESVDPNADAINAILADAQRNFSLDVHRIYLVGQSGTARASWIFGYGLRGHVAGIIGIGASTPANFTITPRARTDLPALVYFGAAGTTDYNYEEVRALDTTLARVNLPHRITFYDGPHTWAPAETLAEGVEFMELMAMRFGLTARRQPWIDSSYATRMARAAALADHGDEYHAWLGYRAVANDFDGLHDTRAAAATAAKLGKSRSVRDLDERLERAAQLQRAYNARLATFFGSLQKSEPADIGKAVAAVQLPDLDRRMASTDTVDANAATRGLEQLWVYASFYEPMDYLAEGDANRALGVLGLAQAMRPNDPEVCWQEARALARLGQQTEAVSALECAARGAVSPEQVEREGDFKPLAMEPAFRALVNRMRTKPSGQSARAGW